MWDLSRAPSFKVPRRANEFKKALTCFFKSQWQCDPIIMSSLLAGFGDLASSKSIKSVGDWKWLFNESKDLLVSCF